MENKVFPKKVFLKINMFGLCGIAWVPWQHIMLSNNEMCIQNNSHLSCYLSKATKLGIKSKLGRKPVTNLQHMQTL